MSNNLVFSIAIDAGLPEEKKLAYELCARSQQAYAERIGAKYVRITEPRLKLSGLHNDEKFLIHDLLLVYDRILFLDADVLIKPDVPNIFDVYQDRNKVFMLNETKHNHSVVMDHFVPEILEKKPELREGVEELIKREHVIAYYNVGVVLVSKECREMFDTSKDYFTTAYWRADQDFINFQIWRNYVEGKPERVANLPLVWNGMLVYDPNASKNCYFIHYAGGYNDLAIKDYCTFYREDAINTTKIPHRYFLKNRYRTTGESIIGIRSLATLLSGVGLEVDCGSGETTEIIAPRCTKLYAMSDWKNGEDEHYFHSRIADKPQVEIVKDFFGTEKQVDFVYLNDSNDILFYSEVVRPGGLVCGLGNFEEVERVFGKFDGKQLHSFCDGSWVYHKQAERD